MNAPAPERPPRGLRWLSEDYAVLRERTRAGARYDVLVVGSGYGGAMAALELAGLARDDGRGDKLRIAVLERGKEYAPGMFPSSLEEVPGHVRVHRGKGQAMGRLEGLLDVRIGDAVCAIVGNGLGGGSLVNAGVMEIPRVQPGQWPRAWQSAFTPDAFQALKDELGATTALHAEHPRLRAQALRKTEELRRVARAGQAAFRDAAITVQATGGDPHRPQCTLCGDCMTGCNVGAKKSLDTTLLARARARGAEIYTGGSVLRVRQDEDGDWLVQTTFTNDSLRQRHEPLEVRAQHVVLAAGTLGSTEILLRSRSPRLRLSARLGHRFSCNGDNLVAVHDGPFAAGPGAREWEPLQQRHVGPTITGVVDLDGLLVQEFAVPAAVRLLFEETVTTSSLLHRLSDWPRRTVTQKRQRMNSMGVDPHAMDHTLLVGLIGHDDSQWRITLPKPPPWEKAGRAREGGVRIEREKGAPPRPARMEQDFERVRALLQRASAHATVVPNPLWRLLPREMEFLVQGSHGPVLTVHPLGGCAVGASHADGVVNAQGQVFRRPDAQDPGGVYDTLMVLDASVLPGSLGANPALTIAAVARHGARALAQRARWKPAGTAAAALPPRPQYRPPAACTPPRPRPTLVELVERLAGPVGEHWVELTLSFRQVRIARLATQDSVRLQLKPDESHIRVYARGQDARGQPASWREVRSRLLLLKEYERDLQAVLRAPLSGRLTVHEPALGWMNVVHMGRSMVDWWRNRGLREFADWWEGRGPDVGWTRFPHSAMRAGQQRRFDYGLVVGAPTQVAPGAPALAQGARLRGEKCITYGHRSNPWRQLTEMTLRGMPGVAGKPVLKLDGRFLAGQGFPLMRITRQQNQVQALADFAALGLSWGRMLASTHLWSFRAPDAPPPHRPRRLPGVVPGLPPPRRTWLRVDHGDPGVQALLTHYPQPGSDKPPIVLIHGYSASGNTYTHDAIPRPMARHLWEDGRDVWVLDLRTSAGLRTALRPWHFEDVALADIPLALEHVSQATGRSADVFAHCIGAVMLSMGLLADEDTLERLRHVDVKPGTRVPQRHDRQVGQLRERIRRVVLSQKGPLLVYSDDNVLRAYFMRLLRRVLLPDGYQFRAHAGQGVAGNVLDRVLSTLVYPDDEYDRENPYAWSRRAPWAGFRHRMDALYARDFSLRNIEDRTLDALEDLFGPLNLDTVSQAIHFARKNAITDGSGLPFTANRAALAARWPRGGTLSIHGEENGLADIKSLEVLQSAMRFAGVPYESALVPEHGHQDCLIGRHAATRVFPLVTGFLDRDDARVVA